MAAISCNMKNADLANALTNALGNPHFDPDKVQEQLKEQIDRMAERGENTGSLIALANILPEIAEECKKRY